jgi:arabinose-5-phosphate isomerase
MLEANELPILEIETATFQQAVQTMEDDKMGFVFFKNKNNELVGISSNADLRRGILKQLHHLDKISLHDIINSKPITINENETISQMLMMIKSLPFAILFLPVVNDKHEISGAITFNNLIKGEA